MSHSFCDNCNRVRLLADGRLRLCLFSEKDVDLKKPLRGGKSDQEIMSIIEKSMIFDKPERHGIDKASSHIGQRMMNIGG